MAKLIGYKSPIAHGMWTVSRSLAELYNKGTVPINIEKALDKSTFFRNFNPYLFENLPLIIPNFHNPSGSYDLELLGVLIKREINTEEYKVTLVVSCSYNQPLIYLKKEDRT
jgi:hypothetical protein